MLIKKFAGLITAATQRLIECIEGLNRFCVQQATINLLAILSGYQTPGLLQENQPLRSGWLRSIASAIWLIVCSSASRNSKAIFNRDLLVSDLRKQSISVESCENLTTCLFRLYSR
jgi:hypothetical protein